MTVTPITVQVHSSGRSSRVALVEDVRRGLSKRPKELPPRWFYDERGSQLFEEITRLPEYYLTRAETEILARCARDIACRMQPEAIVELGAGSSTKTRMLIDAARQSGMLSRFVPFDVSPEIVERSARELVAEFPGLGVHAVIGDFAGDLQQIPRLGRQLVVFLGSTIGNFDDQERAAFLAAVRSLLAPGDGFLLGVDLVKDPAELIAAYDDAAGVTAGFNRNVLAVINRELSADFDLGAFEHVALYDPELHRIEMHLRSTRDQWVTIPGVGMRVLFQQGELMRTEISAKFTRPMVEAFLHDAGMGLAAWYTDPEERFALVSAVPA